MPRGSRAPVRRGRSRPEVPASGTWGRRWARCCANSTAWTPSSHQFRFDICRAAGLISRYIVIVRQKQEDFPMWSRREFRFDQFRRQMFERGDLKYVILDQLKDKPAHGYELIKALEERFGGFYSPSPGAVSPTLQMLEDMGYVSSVQEDGRKIYSITDAGRAFMTERRPQVDEVFSRMKERWGAEWGPNAHRMMHDLRNDMRDLVRSVATEARNRWPNPEQQRRIRNVIARAKAEIQAILSEQPAAKV